MPQSSPTDDNLFPSPGIECTTTTDSPLWQNCQEAYENIVPGDPQACPSISREQYYYVTIGTCTIQTYSQLGRAHCLNGYDIQNGILEILARCTKDEGVQGSYTWTKEGNPREGVMLVYAF